jgi:hypothetical protein
MYHNACRENLDVVYNVRQRRDSMPVKRLAYRWFYSLYAYLAESPVQMIVVISQSLAGVQ